MKPAVSSYSFSQYLNNRRLNQLQCIKKAKDLGFEGIEFTELTPDDGSSLSQYAGLERNRSVSVCPLSALCSVQIFSQAAAQTWSRKSSGSSNRLIWQKYWEYR